jgi:hypothetical protein
MTLKRIYCEFVSETTYITIWTAFTRERRAGVATGQLRGKKSFGTGASAKPRNRPRRDDAAPGTSPLEPGLGHDDDVTGHDVDIGGHIPVAQQIIEPDAVLLLLLAVG